jgi:ABC-type transporter Mla subunit MlaD
VVNAIAMLPTISAQLEQVTEHTRSLPEIHAEMAVVAAATTSLDAAMPILVELQQPLPELVPALNQTAERLDRLAVLIASMDATLQFLAAVAEPLQGTAARIGRLTGGRFVRRGS